MARETGRATFNPEFSSTAPAGSSYSMLEVAGEIYTRDGRELPPGTKVEAFVGETRCGVASTRRAGSYSGFIMSIAGPDSVNGCASGARVEFRIDGKTALETITNDPSSQGILNLTIS